MPNVGRPAVQRPPAPPPPPVLQNSSLANGAQTCPLQAQGECTLRKLTVTAATSTRGSQGDDPRFFGVHPDEPDFHRSPATTKTKDRTLSVSVVQPLRGTKTSITDPTLRAQLGQYDLVIDVVCEGPTRDEPKPKGLATIEADAVFAGCCETQSHPVIYEVPKNQCPELPPGGIYWKGTHADKHEFYAPSIGVFDTVSATNPFIWFIVLLQQLSEGPKLIEITTKACGASHWYYLGGRDNDVYLNCLIRIFRKDKYSIKLKCASLVAASRSGSTMKVIAGDGGTTRSRTTSTTVGSTTSSTNTSRTSGVRDSSDGAAPGAIKPTTDVTTQSKEQRDIAARHSTTTSSQTANAGNDPNNAVTPFKMTARERAGESVEFVTTPDGKEPPQGKGKPWEKRGDGWVRPIDQDTPPPRVELVLTRNDQALNVVEGLTKFIEGVFKLKDILENFNALLKKSPSIGWWFSASISALEGSVEGTMERIMRDKVIEGRYYESGWKGTFTFSIMLISFGASASFGFKFDIGWLASAEASVTGSFKTDVPLKGIINTEGTSEIALQPLVTCDITGVAKASVAGYALAEVKASVTGGMTIMDENATPGGLVWTVGAGFGIRGDLWTIDVVGKFIATSAAGGMQPVETILLHRRKLLTLSASKKTS